MPKAQGDDLIMDLVELTLVHLPDSRAAFLRAACDGDTELFSQVWEYVEWNHRMQDFLLEPLYPGLCEHRFAPGDLLADRFRIVREVAQGGMGVVYEAEDERLRRRIALKCARSGFRRRLPPEVRHASEISHPNVCRIFEIHTASTSGGEIDFLTMEFLEGETLAARLSRGPLPESQARAIGRQICAGLAEAHRNQVVHGDLKSNNVILSRDAGGGARAVITDFGLARKPLAHAGDHAGRWAAGAAGSSAAGGTPDYMAPELWKGERASAASDVYALGVVLYELTANRRPYPPGTPWQDRLKCKPSAVHHRWDSILQRCLDPDPARRFPDAGEVAVALEPPLWRRWGMMAAAAIVFAAAVSGTVTYQRATAPKESIRLAMLPIESGVETRDLAERLSRDAVGQLARLKGGNAARLSVIPFDPIRRQRIDTTEKAGMALGATHVLHATLAKQDGKLVVHAVLTDARTRVNSKEWTVEYAPGEIRYAPVALAGMLTSQLGLPPLAVAVTLNPAAMQDYWNGLWYMRRNSTIDTALPLLERSVAADPSSPLSYAALAEAQQWKWFVTKNGVWLERAKESERQAQLRNPDLAQVHRVAGLLSLRQGLYELAVAECLRAIALNPNDGEAHRVLGQAYAATNRLDEALAAYRKAVDVDSGDFRNHQQLGAFYYGRADYTEALPHFLKMVDLAPGEAASHYSLSFDYSSLGRLPEAERELRLAIRLGETPDELHTLGVVLMEEGRYTEAAASILRALMLAPEQLIWRMNLGTAYRLTNRKAESGEAYRRALELAEKEIARDPRDGETRSHLAFVCARLGDSKRAESEIAQALQTSPSDATVRFMAVATFEAMGRREDALGLLSTFSYPELADVSRWPDMADLSQNSRFLQILASRQPK